jgi:hypothetical protein
MALIIVSMLSLKMSKALPEVVIRRMTDKTVAKRKPLGRNDKQWSTK